MTDASSSAVGAVLQQHGNGAWQPLAFFSKRLSSPQTLYSVFGRELLAMYLAVRHFRHHLECRQFTIFTDQKPLTYAISRPDTHYTPREVRQLAYLSEYTTDIKHVSGVDNTAADFLSRMDAIASITPSLIAPDLQWLAADQADDTELLRLRTSPTALQLEDVTLDGQRIVCDLSTGKPRPFVPRTCRRGLFDALHNMVHPGIRAMQRLIAARFV